MKESLILNLSDVSYVCTTADCWTHNRRAYLGVTAHWIDPKNLKRKSVALALKRIIGCQTYDILANIIAEIHRSYKIQNKVCKMITDNGSNFLKVFRIFGEDNNNNNTSNIPDKNIEDGKQEEDDEMEFEIIDVHDILDEVEGIITEGIEQMEEHFDPTIFDRTLELSAKYEPEQTSNEGHMEEETENNI
ncbi:unnamed protein product [Gordionus sp. m RMFG-2023]